MRYVVGIVVGALAATLAGVLFLISGAYNVAATDPHWRVSSWLLQTAMQRSIEVHGGGDRAPAQFSKEQVDRGLRQFAEMCVTCHGAPGKDAGEIGKGLYPTPPDLADSARQWDNPHLFWIIKNGIKMTGMPAFGPTHSDEKIWDIVAFVRQLPDMSASTYAELERSHGIKARGGH
ncbi:MAG: cytochrome c [Hyphomonadaceae bacterium]|jgi:mono/diheme cytochrome c family protein|nr:cytochrome c [Hyphomonadaceae bacterium]